MEDLPSHIMVDILSRLPVKTIIHCKCVCSNWRNLVLDSHFADVHLSRSPASVMMHHCSEQDIGHRKPGILKLLEIRDELDHQRLHHDPVMSLDLNLGPVFLHACISQVGSVNGLMCLWEFGNKRDNTFICNPITREYIILPRQEYHRERQAIIVYGFGVGLQTKEYKVVRIFQGDIPPKPGHETSRPSLLEAEVYTLGSGQWRSLGHAPYWLSGFHGPFLNGRAHWLVLDQDAPEKLCTFDMDNETFELFPSPPCEATEDSNVIHFQSLAVLNGCLCQSDSQYDSQFTMWAMKEYGVKTSWHKEVVINQSISPDLVWLTWERVHLVEGLKDGSILMVYYEDKLLKYCPQSKTIEDVELFDRYFSGMAYRPGFLKLQSFESESVHLFKRYAK